jgi:Uma2 family endonuclease
MVQQATLPEVIRERRIPMTFDEFLDWAPDDGQAEWVEGWGIAYMSNSSRHERVLEFLRSLIAAYLMITDRGELFSANMIMRLRSRPSGRMPDLFVVLTEHRDRVQRQWFEGAADFGLEVLSESSVERDLDIKLHEYESGGLPEYLVADGREEPDTFIWYQREADGTFGRIRPDAHGRYHSRVLPDFWIDPSWLQTDPLPNALVLIRRMMPEAWHQFVGAEDVQGGYESNGTDDSQ